MNCLIIYGHPNPASFNAAIKDTLVEELEKQGLQVRVRDLYALNFDPVLKGSELAGFAEGVYPDDIRREQAHVAWADALVFISPVWWGGPTAILRGYCDRVFSLGFAYAETDKGPVGLLQGKKGYVLNTLGAPFAVYERMGIIQSLRQTIGEIIFGFCAIQYAGHKIFGSVGTCSDEERRGMLDEVRGLATEIRQG